MTPTDGTLATLLGGPPAMAPAPTPHPANPEEVAQLQGPGEIEEVNRLMRENAAAVQAERDEQEVAASILREQGPQTASGAHEPMPPVDVLFERALTDDSEPVIAQLTADAEPTYFDPKAWPAWRRHALTPAVRIPKPFACRTIDGEIAHCHDGYLAVDPLGFPYPIALEVLVAAYSLAEGEDEERPRALSPHEARLLLDRLVVSDDDSEEFFAALGRLRDVAALNVQDTGADKKPPENGETQPERGPAEPVPEIEPPAQERVEVPPAGVLEDDGAFAGWCVELFATGPKERLLAVSETQLEQLDALESTVIRSRSGRTVVSHPFGDFIVAVD